VLEPPPEGFATWDDWRRDIGLPDSELGIGADSIIDPRGDGPRVWFRVEPDAKVVKNPLHLDVHVSGGRSAVDRNVPLSTRSPRLLVPERLLPRRVEASGSCGDTGSGILSGPCDLRLNPMNQAQGVDPGPGDPVAAGHLADRALLVPRNGAALPVLSRVP
jgi:hypothetical protein